MADETQVTLNESVMPMKEGQVDVSNVDIVVDGKTIPNDTDTPEGTPEEETQETTTEVETPVEDNPIETQKETEKVIKEELETKGLSFDEFAEEYQTTGTLSPSRGATAQRHGSLTWTGSQAQGFFLPSILSSCASRSPRRTPPIPHTWIISSSRPLTGPLRLSVS